MGSLCGKLVPSTDVIPLDNADPLHEIGVLILYNHERLMKNSCLYKTYSSSRFPTNDVVSVLMYPHPIGTT